MSGVTAVLVAEEGLEDIGAPTEIDPKTLELRWLIHPTKTMKVRGIIVFLSPELAGALGATAKFKEIPTAWVTVGDMLSVTYKVNTE